MVKHTSKSVLKITNINKKTDRISTDSISFFVYTNSNVFMKSLSCDSRLAPASAHIG